MPHLYVATADGDLLVLDTDGRLVADPHVPAFLADGLTWSSPALADRRIFIASSDMGRPSHFFILGDRPLTAGALQASGDVRSLDVGSLGDMGTGAPERGVSLWSVGEQWGAPTLLDGRSVRKAAVPKPRFVVNLGHGAVDPARPWVLKLYYRSRRSSHVYQYDGSAYHSVATLPGGETWRVAHVVTRPELYGDYPANAANGLNVLFAIITSDAEFYLDRIELRP